MKTPVSPLAKLNPREISRLIFERTRSIKHETQATDLNPNDYRDKGNVFIHLQEARGASEDTVANFHKESKEFAKEANKLIDMLKSFGLQDRLLKTAWKKVENISDEVRALIDLSTDGLTVKDFGRKFIEFGDTLAKLVFRDIIIDEKIDKLGIE